MAQVHCTREKAKAIRRHVVKMCHQAGQKRRAHPGPALSIADILAVLYFDAMRVKPADPDWEDRDRLILSKGHACPALYAALAMRGFFPEAELSKLRTVGGILQGHPDMRKTPGIDMTTGSLGHGLSAAVGIALAGKFIDKKDYTVYVILGCGEIQEGLIWEGAMYAGCHKLDNIVVFIDYNDFQSGAKTSRLLSIEPVRWKWEAFGWHTLEIDGHDVEAIKDAVAAAKHVRERPTVIVAHTTKGKGVSFMENDNAWHQKDISADKCRQALTELEIDK